MLMRLGCLPYVLFASDPSSALCERRDVYMDTYDAAMLVLALLSLGLSAIGIIIQLVSIKRK